MKNFCYALLLLLCISCTDTNPCEGDIIFQTTQNDQSILIEKATKSPMTHCGIIIARDNGLHVLHVDKVVRLTPLATFIKHGVKSQYVIKRATNKEIKIDLEKYILKEYDFQLLFDNNSYYSSELVYDIYKNDLGIELCQPRPIKEYNITGFETMLGERQIKPDQYVVAPADLYNSKKLKQVQTHEDRIKAIKKRNKTKKHQ